MRKEFIKKQKKNNQNIPQAMDATAISDIVAQSFKILAPFWPLKNLIATNPLQGLEEFPIEQALKIGDFYFQQPTLPTPMEAVNRETIKWLQAFFDEGQARIKMPLRSQGLYAAWKPLALYDARLHGNNSKKKEWLRGLSDRPEQAIAECLLRLGISKKGRKQFLTLMLTTLPGWASYIKYRTVWAQSETRDTYSVCQVDYLAIRLIITCLVWPEAKRLLDCYKKNSIQPEHNAHLLKKIINAETTYRIPLLKEMAIQPLQSHHTIPQAQFVFCIDVRSEPFRRALESTGDYQTFGCAGFFGLPVQITHTITGKSYASCPVILSPKHVVRAPPLSHTLFSVHKRYERLNRVKRIYQSLKYTFSTPFALVESLGILSGVWMALRTFFPQIAFKIKNVATQAIPTPLESDPVLNDITLTEQISYAQGILKGMGLTKKLCLLGGFLWTWQHDTK